jgi:cell division protein FtsQ
MNKPPEPPADTLRKGIPISDNAAFLRKFSGPESLPAPRVSMWKRVAFLLLKTGLLAAMACALASLYSYSRDQNLYTIRQVALDGFRHLDRNEVLSLIHSSFRGNLMTLDILELRQRIEKFSWVKGVSVRKVYPDKLYIKIVEREPAGIARMDKLWLFDESGVFLDEYRPAEHAVDHPVLSGLHDASDPMAQDENLERIRRYVDFLKLIDASGTRVSGRISEIDLTDTSDLVVIPLEGTPRVHLGYEKLPQRLDRFLKVVDRAMEENGPIAEMDMRYEDKIIVKPLEIQQAQQ